NLDPILKNNSSIDSSYDRIYHKNKIIEKNFFFEFLAHKLGVKIVKITVLIKKLKLLPHFKNSPKIEFRSNLKNNSSIDSSYDRIYHKNKIIEKNFFFEFL